MDRKSIFFLVACFAVLLILQPVLNHFFPPIPKAPAPVTAPSVAGQKPAAGTPAPTALAAPAAGVANWTPASSIPSLVASTNVPEEVRVVTHANARYTFTSRGGGLKGVELLKYPETVSSRRQRQVETNQFAPLNTPVAPPVLALLGGESLQGDGVFKLTPVPNGMRAEKTLGNGLSIVKDFQFSSNYLVVATVRLANTSTQALTLPPQEYVVGAATPMGPQDNGTAVNVSWYNGTKVEPVGLPYFNTNTSSFIFFSRTPLTEYRGGHGDVVWVAAQNQFFTLAVMPTNAAAGLVVRMIDLPPPTEEEMRAAPHIVAAPHGLYSALAMAAQTLAPGQAVTQQFNLFAGPKEYHLLADLGERLNNSIDLVMGFNGFFGTFARLLLFWMNWFHSTVNLPFGWSIVLITVLLKVLFWPLTAYSTKSMKRMAALQPQMKAMQEKYKDDPTKLSQKQMEFWKEHKVNPLSGCLPMLLQMPVLLGFYRMLQSAIELRGSPFLWIGDLSRPDTIYTIFLPASLPLIGSTLPINPMPLIMGATMLWQAQLAPPSPGMDPGQQKVMRYMPLIMLVILYNFSSGLALYWTVQNLLTILQTKLTATAPVAAAKTTVSVAPRKKN